MAAQPVASVSVTPLTQVSPPPAPQVMINSAPPPQKRSYGKIIGIVLAILIGIGVLILIILAATGFFSKSNSASTASTAPPTVILSNPTPPAPTQPITTTTTTPVASPIVTGQGQVFPSTITVPATVPIGTAPLVGNQLSPFIAPAGTVYRSPNANAQVETVLSYLRNRGADGSGATPWSEEERLVLSPDLWRSWQPAGSFPPSFIMSAGILGPGSPAYSYQIFYDAQYGWTMTIVGQTPF